MSLEMRPDCDHCGVALPPDSPAAMICSFECTFCYECAVGFLKDVCPNCGGNFCVRPTRVGAALARHPASTARRHPVAKTKKRA
jgi:hypothetical protein